MSLGALALPTNTEPAKSVVKIETSEGLGSGVDIGKGVIVTARHVVGSDTTVKITLRDGSKHDAQVLWTDSVHDVAAVQITDAISNEASSSLSCSVPALGSEIEVVGNPMGIEFITSWGKVSSDGLIKDHDITSTWKDAIIIQAAGGPGNSGGPVYDSEGRVVGLLVGGVVSPNGFTGFLIVVPSSTVCAAMAEQAKLALVVNQ